MLRVIPSHLSPLNGYFESGVLRADVVMVHLSAPDESGEYSFGTANDFVSTAIEAGAGCNRRSQRQLPWTFCEPRVDAAVSTLSSTRRALQRKSRAEAIGRLEQEIAAHIGRYIEDGTTIQIGIGAIPDAVLGEP